MIPTLKSLYRHGPTIEQVEAFLAGLDYCVKVMTGAAFLMALMIAATLLGSNP